MVLRRKDEAGLMLGDYQLASGCASMTQKIVLHPVDTIKTRLQHLRLTSKEFKNPAAHVVRFIRVEGLRGLYRGVTSALLGSIPVSMVYMPSYEVAKRALPQDMPASLRHLCAGSVAGVLGSIVRTPVDLIKKRTQVGIYANVWEALREILGKGGGIRALWGGTKASLLYDVPYNMVQFTILEQVKRLGKQFRNGKDLDGWENICVGASTGILTSLITEPLDVVKTRLMTQMGYTGWWNALSRTMREEGVLALWKGTIPRMFWVAAGSAIWYSVYENVRLRIARAKTKAPVVPVLISNSHPTTLYNSSRAVRRVNRHDSIGHSSRYRASYGLS